MHLFHYFIYFMIYSIIGYLVEVFAVYKDKKIVVNRGFLFGPYIPIYGFGALLIYFLLNDYRYNPVLIFFLSIVIAFILEYITSYILEIIFNDKWWDYKDKKYNISGRVCLETLVPFSILSLISIYAINPFIFFIISKINSTYVLIITIFLLILYIIDSISSIYILLKVKKINYRYDKLITKKVKKISRSINKDHEKYERNNNEDNI